MYAIGLDIGGTTLKLGLVRNGQEIVYRDTRPSVHEASGLARAAGEMIRKAWALHPEAPAGISCAGAFDPDGLWNANQLHLERVPLPDLLRQEIGRDIPLENDGVCALLAELDSGSLRNCRTGIMVTLGTGIGGGVIVDGKPYSGYMNNHAELGHMITHADGIRCSCGQTGCWEIYASAGALSRAAGGLSPQEVLRRVEQGGLSDVWENWLHEVAQGLIGLCAVFFPEIIAIGGGLSNAGDTLIGGIRRAMEADPGFQAYYSFVRLVSTHFRNDAGMLGAAALAMRNEAKINTDQQKGES